MMSRIIILTTDKWIVDIRNLYPRND